MKTEKAGPMNTISEIHGGVFARFVIVGGGIVGVPECFRVASASVGV